MQFRLRQGRNHGTAQVSAFLVIAKQRGFVDAKQDAPIVLMGILEGPHGADGDVFQAAWRSLSLALMEYRRGNYSTAVEWAHRCLGYPEYNAPRAATAHVILAMACHQQGQTEEARSELAQARQAIENKFHAGLERGTGVQGFWFDWVFGRILLREAMSLINVSSEVSDKAAGGR